jgi:undecaprenyl phosphate-alpha-L-ara4FN deformylase
VKQIVLKVDVDTFTGTLRGVPALLELFEWFGLKATFLFSVGPDHTGRALRRVFRKGFLKKVGRTSVVSHYGIRTLFNGVLWPGPHIGKKASHIMRQVADAGHEVGIHCYDHVLWQDFVANRGLDWTRSEMNKARQAYVEALGQAPHTLGAAGWQLNKHVIALEEDMGFEYASDVRGRQPFFPHMEGIRSNCMQLPTTLPTLDEIIGADGIDESNCHRVVFEKSGETLPHGHVYTLHAELEGMKLIPVMRRLLDDWKAAKFGFITLGQLHQSVDQSLIPVNTIEWGEVEGRSGLLAVQGSTPTGL